MLRRLADTDHQLRAVWSSHNLAIMTLEAVTTAVGALGLELRYSDYVMHGQVWIDPRSAGVKPGARWLVKAARNLDRLLCGACPPHATGVR